MAGQQQQQQQRSDQQFLTSALSVYATEVRKAINNQQEQLHQLEAAHEQLQQTLDSLEQLPTKLRHPVMVPMGKHAFFPGHITRTNEVLVHLGGQYYVEVTAAHARGILQRKQAAVAEGISKAQQQLKALRARLEVSSDSIGSATADEPEAHEIRSSLAESDALLATAPPRAGKAAALSGTRQQQQQAQRVRSSSGYSYTRPQGASTEQRSPQQDAEDAELQARLEQLQLLEQQQELQDLLQDTPATEQQQQQLGPGLGTIQEGEEDSEDEAPAAAAAAAVEGSTGSVGSARQLSAVHHLQQLEAQSDSDDDVAAYQPQPEQQQPQQQPQQQQQRSPGQGQQSAAQQQLQQQQRPPLKSALKKGFLGTAGSSSSSSSSSSSRGRAADRSASTQVPAKPQPAAFTGTVVERAPPQAAAAVAHPPAVGGIVERPVQAGGSSTVSAASGGSSGSSSSSSNKPMSKFKLRRLGLDPQDD